MEATGGMIIGTTITIITVPVHPTDPIVRIATTAQAVTATCQAITTDCPEIGCGAPDLIFP